MSNGYVGDRSWRLEATYSQTGVSATGYPITQLQNESIGLPWRSLDTTLANTKFTITFPKLRPITSVAFINHNFSRTAKYTLKLWRDLARTQLLFTINLKDVFPKVVYGIDNPIASWDAGNFWYRTIQDEDLINLTRQFAAYTDKQYFVRIIDVEFFDENSIEDYIQIGVVDPAAGFFFPYQFDYGSQYGLRSRTTLTEAKSGQEFAQRAEARDVMVGSIPASPINFALQTWFDFQRRCDKHTPFWWSPDINDLVNAHRLSYWAKNDDLDLATYAQFELNSTPFVFKKVL